MSTIDVAAHLAELYARRDLLEAGLAEVGQRIEVAERFAATLESPLSVPFDPVPPASDRPSQSAGATRGRSSRRGPKSADHPAVRALRADDLRPYQRHKQNIMALASRYAELHDGVIYMKSFVPIAIRVGLCKAEHYKDAWGALYRPLERDAQFVRAGKGMFRLVAPAPDEAAEADAA